MMQIKSWGLRKPTATGKNFLNEFMKLFQKIGCTDFDELQVTASIHY